MRTVGRFSKASVVVAGALLAVAGAACRRSTPTPSPRPDVAAPAPDAAPALDAAADAGTAPDGGLAPGSEDAVRAAIGAAAANAPLTPTPVDADGDGTADALYSPDAGGCYVALRRGDAWRVTALAVERAGSPVRCEPVLRAGSHVMLAASAGAHADGDGPGAQMVQEPVYAVYFVAPGGAPRRVWYGAVPGAANVPLTALPDGALRVTRRVGEGELHMVLRANQTGTLAQVSCWQPEVLVAAPVLQDGCTAGPRAPVLYETEAASRGARVEGARVSVHYAGTRRRGPARAFCVATEGGRIGYMFLRPDELTGCPRLP